MLVKLLISLAPIALILVSSEYLWNKKIIQGERARKLIHSLVGIHVAFWPFYIPFDGIFVLGCMMLAVVLYVRAGSYFKAIHTVDRKTFGDVFYALAIIVCAYFGREVWVFTLSMLLLALADGAAAVVGRTWGIKNHYHVFGVKALRKSVVGSLAFVFFVYIAVAVTSIVGGYDVLRANTFTVLVLMPIGAIIMENISPYGSDNLTIPLFTTLLLNSIL